MAALLLCRRPVLKLTLARTIGTLSVCTRPGDKCFRLLLPRTNFSAFSSRLISSSSNRNKEEFFKPTDTLSDVSGTGETVTTNAADVAAQVLSSNAPDVVDLASVGLGGFWPSGLVQTMLEMLFNYAHLPWWGCIVALTGLLRLALLPLNVKMQVMSARLANANKEAKIYHARMEECKAAGDTAGASQAGIDMFKMYERERVNPLMMFPLAMAQAPVFLSMLNGLRGMANLPVDSLKTGGAFWFTNLSIPDPYFALPLLACTSFLVNLEVSGLLFCWTRQSIESLA